MKREADTWAMKKTAPAIMYDVFCVSQLRAGLTARGDLSAAATVTQRPAVSWLQVAPCVSSDTTNRTVSGGVTKVRLHQAQLTVLSVD